MRVRIGCWIVAAVLAGVPASGRTRAADFAFDVEAQFQRYDPIYRADRKAAREPLAALTRQVQALEAMHSPAVRCAQQRLTELRVITHDTAWWAEARAETEALRGLLADPASAAGPDRQDAEGAWGRCYHLWYLRLDASYDAISERVTPLPTPARFLDRVNSPGALSDYLHRIAVSDIAADGVDHRRELNYAVSALMRLILHDQPIGYPWADGMKTTIRQLLLDELRDPASGTWGPRYRHDGLVTFVPDVSITFHVVKYLGGAVPDWPNLLDTLFAMRTLQYPQGWMEGDGFLAHDLYDVATLYRLGWPHARPDQRLRMAADLQFMREWCLANVVSPDGAVTVFPGDDSIETATYFAVSLLGELGVFEPGPPFWADRALPTGPALGARIAERIRTMLDQGGGAEGGTYYRNALERLDAAGGAAASVQAPVRQP